MSGRLALIEALDLSAAEAAELADLCVINQMTVKEYVTNVVRADLGRMRRVDPYEGERIKGWE